MRRMGMLSKYPRNDNGFEAGIGKEQFDVRTARLTSTGTTVFRSSTSITIQISRLIKG